MIRITCTSCKQLLTIDDAFAGGVCRCQFCGTIQTVPFQAKGSGDAPAKQPKTLYRNAARNPGSGSGSGLDQLANVVTSSGLEAHVRHTGPRPGGNGSTVTIPAGKNKMLLLVMVAAGVIVVLVGVIAVLMLARGPQPFPIPVPPGGPGTGVATAQGPGGGSADGAGSQGPNFCGMVLQGDSVVYVVDNGNSATEFFSSIQGDLYQSIKSLGPTRQFKVIFWEDSSPAFPPDGMAYATPDKEKAAESAFADVFAHGRTEVDKALKAAVAVNPATVVLVTAKALQLSDDFDKKVLSIRGKSSAKIYTVGINGDSTGDPNKPGILTNVAVKTGGQFLNISQTDLARFAR